MTETRTPDEIEHDIQRERARLSGSINQLQEKFAMDSIIREIGDGLRDESGEIGRLLGRAVRRNPAAFVVTGVGLVWLLMGKRASVTGFGDSASAPRGTQDRAWNDYQSKAMAGEKHSDRMRDAWTYGDSARKDEGGIASRASSPAQSLGTSVRAAAGTVSDTASAIGENVAAVRERMSETAHATSEAAREWRDRLTRGTESLSEEARSRVVAARQAAWDAAEAVRSQVDRGTRAASDLFEQQPLVVGGIGLAIGAAIGGLIPRSKIEDQNLGAHSDALYAEAERVYREELHKAQSVARAAADEAGNVLDEAAEGVKSRLSTLGDAAHQVADEVENATNRVAGAARKEAEKQGLQSGKPLDRSL